MDNKMSVDDLVKLLDSFSEKGGASIKPQFENDKAKFVVGNGETLSPGMKKTVDELSDILVEQESKDNEIFVADTNNNCAACANIPNLSTVDSDKDYE